MDRSNKQEWNAWMRQYRASPRGKLLTAAAGAKGRRKPHGRFMEAKYHAKRRGIDWKLDEPTFTKLVVGSVCHYCEGRLPETCAALDRTDNSKGYIPGNVVPCCWDCNTMKGKFLTYEEMMLVWERRKAA